ncbi:interleukin-9 isoform X1 [Nannospalax galili]|uniref:Interleukin 9 n=1 Tax=Nannospalax galili TaxID=1026970 RepID=A0A8C6QET4_NANGA|nr:interleukin-9 isoform X1 [Nannospalax galili]
MFVATVLVSSLLFCSVQGQRCLTSMGILHVNSLINNLQKDPSSTCSCSTNATSCLCLPIPPDNCTTPCFREGLSQLINVTQNTPLSVFFQRVRRTVEDLKNNKCSFFTCEQPCNQTTASNTVTFLRSLLGTFQKEGMRERKGRI